MKEKIIKALDPKLVEFLKAFVELYNSDTLILRTTNIFNVYANESFKHVVNLRRVNRVRRINKFFIGINESIDVGGTYVCCCETLVLRRKRIRILRIPVLNSIYKLFNFIFHRLFPKVWGLKKIYFTITRGRMRQLSKSEFLGRLYSCGFKVNSIKEINGLLYAVAEKTGAPIKHKKPSYGAIYKMPRVGKNGKSIKVYKFRTMHPYSEFLQDYILIHNGYDENGKVKDDFRLTRWGMVMRKLWFDELPQLINVVKGEMKIVGVRPVSARYLQDIDDEYKKLRILQKPGCVPPTIALNTKTNIEEAIKAEKKYIKLYTNHPVKTDLVFFFKALYNIFFKGKRSA